MKKLVIMMIVSCLMMLCSVGFAADDHKALAKQQQVVEKFLDAFDGEPVPLYAQVSACFNPKMKEAKFFTYQRFDQADRVTYIGSFTKEKIVSMIFAFDKQNKLVDFALTPVQQPQAAKK